MTIFFLLVFFIAAGLLLLSRQPSIEVHGNLSKQEVSEIVAAVRHDVWREAFPDSSWRTIRRAPRALWAVSAVRFSEVNRIFENRARVKGRFRLETKENGMLRAGSDSWEVKREKTGWIVRGRSLTSPQGDPRVASTFNERLDFSTSLSNASRMSLDTRQ